MENDFKDFLQHIQQLYAKETHKAKGWQIGAFYRWLVKHERHYSNLTGSDIESYILRLKCCRENKINILNTLRQFYDYHGIDPNPTTEIIIKPMRKRKLYKVPAPAEITRKIRSIHSPDALVELRDRLMVELAYGSGLRRGEIMRLDVEDLRLNEQTAYITGKGDRRRIVPLTSSCCEMLKEYLITCKTAGGPVFTNIFTGRRLSLNHISKIFHTRTGIHTHAYRHACATHLLQNGCDIRMVQELLGHHKIDTTQIYTHLKTGDLRKALTMSHPRSSGRIKS
jgi:integrase/recombinase XerC